MLLLNSFLGCVWFVFVLFFGVFDYKVYLVIFFIWFVFHFILIHIIRSKIRACFEQLLENSDETLWENLKTLTETAIANSGFGESDDEDIGEMLFGLSCAGGGAKNYYGWGVIYCAQKLGVKFSSAAGASSGSWVAFGSVAKSHNYAQRMVTWKEACGCVTGLDSYPACDIDGWIDSVFGVEKGLPDESRLYVTVTYLGSGVDTISKFQSIGDLMSVIKASGALPMLTTAYGLCCNRLRGKFAIDGGWLKNNPVHMFHTATEPVLRIDNYPSSSTRQLLWMTREELVETFIKGVNDCLTVLEDFYGKQPRIISRQRSTQFKDEVNQEIMNVFQKGNLKLYKNLAIRDAKSFGVYHQMCGGGDKGDSVDSNQLLPTISD